MPYAHREDRLQNQRQRYSQLRRQVLEALGDRCFKCGFGDHRALQVDHRNGGGSAHRRKMKYSSDYYRSILSDLKSYMLLCANCNWIKRFDREEHSQHPRRPRKETP